VTAGADLIEAAVRAAAPARGLALAAFVTAGYPSRDGFAAVVDAVAAEADLVEIGVPFSDPMADGVTIQRASHAALQAGVTLRWILDVLGERDRAAPLLLMSYLNPLIAFGLERLAEEATAAGVAGCIVPDLPYEECGPLRDALDTAGLALVQLVTPQTPGERLRLLASASRGFVYAVTAAGTTGGAATFSPEVLAYLDRVRAASPLPVLAGFGVREAAQLRALVGHADGVVVGSALVEVLEKHGDPAAFLRGLRGGARGTTPGTTGMPAGGDAAAPARSAATAGGAP
jgi:tryptophan synthase alpha chain